MFTKQQIQEIRDKLALYSVKDSQFSDATLPLSGEEYVSLLQEGLNVKTTLKAFQDLVITSLPQVVVGSIKNGSDDIIQIRPWDSGAMLVYKKVIDYKTENYGTYNFPVVNTTTAGLFTGAMYQKFLEYQVRLDDYKSSIAANTKGITVLSGRCNALVSRCDTIQGTASSALGLANTIRDSIIPPIEVTANEGKALATTCRNLIDQTNSNVSKLFELNAVYTHLIHNLTTESTAAEVKAAFTPIIGGTAGVVNTPHVGYLIQGKSNADSIILSVNVGMDTTTSGEKFTAHKILYINNDSGLYSLIVRLDAESTYYVKEHKFLGYLNDVYNRISHCDYLIDKLNDECVDVLADISEIKTSITSVDTKIDTETTRAKAAEESNKNTINTTAGNLGKLQQRYTELVNGEYKIVNGTGTAEYSASGVGIKSNYLQLNAESSPTENSVRYVTINSATETTAGAMSAADKTQLATNTSDIADLKEKTPTMWANLLAVKDTAVMVDGVRVELPAHKNVVIKDFKTFALATNTPIPKCITRFDIHYNGVAKIKSLKCGLYYTPTDGDLAGYGLPITSLDTSCLDTSEVTDFDRLFTYCYGLTDIDVSGWDTSNATSMYALFFGCPIPSIDVSGWNIDNSTNIAQMFSGCRKLTALDLSSFRGGKFFALESFCASCTSLQSLNICNLDTTSLKGDTALRNTFIYCTSLTDITFGEGFGKAKKEGLTLDLSSCGSGKNYVLTDNTYNSMLTMYDRATNGLPTFTIKFSTKHNIPDGFIAAMTARGYTITQG